MPAVPDYVFGCYGVGLPVVCDITEKPDVNHKATKAITLTLLSNLNWTSKLHRSHLVCPEGDITYTWLACSKEASCYASDAIQNYVNTKQAWDVPSRSSCQAPMWPLPPSFRCRTVDKRVPYSLLCDDHRDCLDNSDEDFCTKPDCPPGFYHCGDSHQMPPAVIRFDSYNMLEHETFHGACPETHFQCANNGYCLPVYMRCNQVNDCPTHEDEVGCEHSQCQGFYRCFESKTCLHNVHVCDGKQQCPHHDDELFCLLQTFACPSICSCFGFALICEGFNSSMGSIQDCYGNSSIFKDMRYLHISDSVVDVENITNLPFLVNLGLPHCGLRHFPDVNLPSLHNLDLSNNLLQTLVWLQRYINLRVLSLSGNPLGRHTMGSLGFEHPDLLSLDLSHITLPYLGITHYKFLPNLQSLNLSNCKISEISVKKSGDNDVLQNLLYLDISGSAVYNFPPDVFHHMSGLTRVRTDNPKLCCPAMFQQTSRAFECITPLSDVMSCEALLQTVGYRAILYLFTFFSLSGNTFSFFVRVFVEKATKTHGFAVFVTHLSLSDFIMGVYLAIIGVADYVYSEEYFWQEHAWTQSVACKTAGFLCLLSSEVSAFLIALITLDRYLVLRFPFRLVRFSVTSATTTVVIVWIIGLIISTVPLLPMTSHWRIYGGVGTCFSLPFATDFPGRDYSFGVVIIVNFALFFFVALGQALMYLTIREHSMSLQNLQCQNRDINIARRLIAIALSDFLCWFPVGLLGVLASTRTHIPRDLDMLVAISVMPLNSALNPFWYTLNLVLESIRVRQEQNILSTLKKRQTP